MPQETEVIEEKVEEIVEVPVDEVIEEKVEEKTSKTDEILESINKKLDRPVEEKGPTPEAIRAAWREQVKKETQMTDAQLDFMENRMQAVTAPLYADQTYAEWKAEKQSAGITIEPDVEKDVKEYLSRYDPRARNDKVLLDNVLFMSIGKRSLTKKPVAAAPKGAAPETKQPVIGRTIVPQTPAPATSLAAGVRKPGGAALTPEEKVVARKMRMTEAEYAAAKETAVVSELKKK